MMPPVDPAAPDSAARRLVARAEVDDPPITGMMRAVVDGSGGLLVGLDHRIKTVESLARKLADLVADDPTLTVEDAALGVYDVLRYTVVAEADVYVEVHDWVLSRLADAGVMVVLDSNRWAGGLHIERFDRTDGRWLRDNSVGGYAAGFDDWAERTPPRSSLPGGSTRPWSTPP